MSPLDLMQKHLDADVKDNTKSPRTREIYIDIARRLFAGTLTQETIHSKSRFHQVAAVIDYLKTIDAIPEAETFGLKLRFLKNRFRKKMTAGNQIERIKQKVLTDEQFDELLSAIPDTPCGDELRLACQIARHSGLRRNEVLSLTPQAIKRLPDGISLHVHGKGRKDRRASLPLSMAYLFDGFTGFTISAGYVNMGMRRAMKKAGLSSSFHGLRHTYATEQALFGANAYELAAEMGHSDINTTLIYAHVPDAIPQSKLAFWQKKGMV